MEEEEVVSVSRLVVYRCRLHVARGLLEYARALVRALSLSLADSKAR